MLNENLSRDQILSDELTQEYFTLPLEALRTDAVLDCQIYLKVLPGKFVKYRSPGLPFDDVIRNRLKENKHSHIYIHESETKKLHRYLEINLQNTLADFNLPTEKKAEVLYETTSYFVKILLTDPHSGESVRRARSVVDTSVGYLLDQPGAIKHVINISLSDYYTYSHSVHVMIYSIALGKRLGYNKGKQLKELGYGGLFHDIGKSFIDQDVLHKPSRLTDSEFDLVKRHSEFGFKVLKENKEISSQVLNTVLRHHESLDGGGYPSGWSGSKIDLDARIISVSDIYDALTTRRVYRDAIPVYPALQQMKDLVGHKIDGRVFTEFVKMLGEI